MPRLTTRDFKRPAQRAPGAGRLTAFALGVIVGAALASGAFLLRRAHARHATRTGAAGATRAAVAPGDAPTLARAPVAAASAPAPPAATGSPVPQKFDFYSMLPRFKVSVPQEPGRAAPVPAAAPAGAPSPGTSADHGPSYVLQVGSYRRNAEAQQVRDRLAHEGIDARVERVLAAGVLWYRVRIGPISDPQELERVRSELRAAGMSALELQLRPH